MVLCPSVSVPVERRGDLKASPKKARHVHILSRYDTGLHPVMSSGVDSDWEETWHLLAVKGVSAVTRAGHTFSLQWLC